MEVLRALIAFLLILQTVGEKTGLEEGPNEEGKTNIVNE